MNLNLAVDGGSVEVADTAFGREYNEASCIKSSWLIGQVLVKARARIKIALQSAAVAGSHGGRKAQAAQEQVPRVHQSGDLVALLSRHSRKTIPPRSTAKCIAAHYSASCLS